MTDADAAPDQVFEDAAVGTVVSVTAFAEDPDAGDVVTYTLAGNAGGRFAIDPATGVITVAGPLDFETVTSHAVMVRATSTDASFSERVFTIVVLDVNESVGAPTDADATPDLEQARHRRLRQDHGVRAGPLTKGVRHR